MNQFIETLKRFREFTNYTNPLSFEEWKDLEDTNKQVAVLFCQFYETITLAWYKSQADYINEEDGVSCVLQYLLKNVEKIKEAKSKFTSGYIYRISYNCMDCLRYVQRDRDKQNETTNVVIYEGEELDLCDLVPHEDIDFEAREIQKYFWSVIKDMGEETEKVVNYLLNGESLRRVPTRSKAYGIDPLTHVGVNKTRFEEIMEELRSRLAVFKPVYY